MQTAQCPFCKAKPKRISLSSRINMRVCYQCLQYVQMSQFGSQTDSIIIVSRWICLELLGKSFTTSECPFLALYLIAQLLLAAGVTCLS
ncbi:hypothetical protein BCR33DRAFT_519250 [Rhizoclosmatium globosum]|uniref:Uncharacterized protein n=1 Tax=Rhizoclosmatium globosum TaxID=329046 RepID=A0A1Y2BFI9_9FUNG|nr:hypothetical protein BCR33DRAFT_519250 [Rhizoclosmatium globosum]|eukprot:ORY33573.1 hypothetical protein BCR33DRAFT_519250 [Rhizoclosmatium globosum]